MEKPSKEANPKTQISLHIPAITYLKTFFAAVLVFALIKLAPLLLIVLLSILLAATFHPVVEWIESKGFPRAVGLSLVIFTLLACVAVSIIFLIPAIVEQVKQVASTLPKIQHDLLERFPDGPVHQFIERFSKDPNAAVGGEAGGTTQKLLAMSFSALDSVASFGIFLITAIYLLVDGKGTYKWLSAFLSKPNQKKLDQTAEEMSHVVFAYVAGQAITSGLVCIFTFVVLKAFHVPAALVLAVIAGLFDLLPIVGFLASVALIGLMALTVSSTTALSVLALCVGYHFIENYVLIPRIYGNRLRLSTLVVLLSFLIAGTLAGVPGAILVLPLVASYPIIEKIWLRGYLGDETVREHCEVETTSPSELRK